MSFVALCVNGLVAYPPAGHPEAGRRGREWPRMMAAASAVLRGPWADSLLGALALRALALSLLAA